MRAKIDIAGALNVGIIAMRSLAGRRPIVTSRLRGVNWRLDLNEQIDFAIFLAVDFAALTAEKMPESYSTKKRVWVDGL